MVETTYDALPDVAQQLLDKGQDVTLYAVTNVAIGTPGWGVHCLVRRGLWREIKRHIADDPMMSYTVYGPAQ